VLGAGLGYVVSVPLLILFGGDSTARSWPVGVAWFIAILINGPHYGATLLRVYGKREERRRYAAISVWTTLLLLLAFVAGVYHPLIGSLLLTVYFTWSPWHFAGQNYGVALMFFGRARIEVDGRTRLMLKASFVLSFLLTVVAMNAVGSTSLQAPTRSGRYEDLEVLRLGVPDAITRVLLLSCGTAYLCSVAGAMARLWRRAQPRQLLPVGSLVLCQALWFAVPSVLEASGAWSTRSLAFAAIWISAAHSLQYLWVTFHYAEQNEAETRLPSYLLKTTLAGNAAIVIPGLVFAPGLLGASLSWEAGLSALVFAVVNLHHFVLDGAVWRLRDGRVARLLLRTGRPDVARPCLQLRHRWRGALWAVLGLCLVVEVTELARQQALRRGAWDVADATFGALAWAGREHALGRIRFGRALLDSGDFAGARIQFESSLAVRPTRAAWGGLGRALEGEGAWRGAAEAYEAGLELDPDDAALLRSAGIALLRLNEPERALPLLERALEIEPDHDRTRRALARARRALGR
jgi:tetratricopeptide (TPR) repeat protein